MEIKLKNINGITVYEDEYTNARVEAEPQSSKQTQKSTIFLGEHAILSAPNIKLPLHWV